MNKNALAKTLWQKAFQWLSCVQDLDKGRRVVQESFASLLNEQRMLIEFEINAFFPFYVNVAVLEYFISQYINILFLSRKERNWKINLVFDDKK